ncbi:LuxR family transcriptional regulator [Actinorhabdospora filicis]|uniref:LuxR family transcriptional regulator n=1 Tax=Actinorhabdospora filicis TaxID=1785913 RepID=A0A9W6SPY1_9ACTN|nr:LuxR family transcriptional regulator [Actinorhabdospora filicis]GLZ79727.1 LuxR family transcriptional regulator [Actinorhabdospora filicis]
MLYGRAAEVAAIGEFLAGEHGRVLVLRGEDGIGKTALIEHAVARATEATVLRCRGAMFEAMLPYSGLTMLLRDLMGGLDGLPAPQRTALAVAFGLEAGPPPEAMFIGLAVLTLLAEAAAERPVLIVVDDAEWWDPDSSAALLFAVRRMSAENVALLMATERPDIAAGFGELILERLSPVDAAALLDAHAELSPGLRYRVLTEARGNPLALLELPRVVTGEDAIELKGRLARVFATPVPEEARLVLLVAARGARPELVARAAEAMGAGPANLAAARATGLLTDRMELRHPLVRHAIPSTAAEDHEAHRAIAEVSTDPDERAYHRGMADLGHREDVAAELEAAAGRVAARGALASARTYYIAAAERSPDRDAANRRNLSAAELDLAAGRHDIAEGDLARMMPPYPPEVRARVTGVRAAIAMLNGDSTRSFAMAMEETARPDTPPEAASLLMCALMAAWYSGEDALAALGERLAGVPGADAEFVSAALRGRVGSLPEAVAAAGDIAVARLLIMCGIGLTTGQDAEARVIITGLLERIRAEGAAGLLPTALFFLAEADVFAGRHEEARAGADEARRLARDTGQRHWEGQFAALGAYLAGIQGREEECRRLSALVFGLPGEPGGAWARAGLARLHLGAGRPGEAFAELDGVVHRPELCMLRAVPDLAEAAVRLGEPERAAGAVAFFEAWAGAVDRAWAWALVERCRALLAGEPEAHYLAALDWHGKDRRAGEEARTLLLYGEWLRRAKRKGDARERLTAALEIFERQGAEPWARRAREELTATGAAVPSTAPDPLAGLTPQESRIVRLAAEGLSNKDIAATLFLSPRTVGYHLYKAYPKLGVLSRGELAGAI